MHTLWLYVLVRHNVQSVFLTIGAARRIGRQRAKDAAYRTRFIFLSATGPRTHQALGGSNVQESTQEDASHGRFWAYGGLPAGHIPFVPQIGVHGPVRAIDVWRANRARSLPTASARPFAPRPTRGLAPDSYRMSTYRVYGRTHGCRVYQLHSIARP